jgi:cysteine-S-conjugate beta-lyase
MADKQTQLAHLGRHPRHHKGAVNTPVVRTSTILFDDYASYLASETGKATGVTYGRHGTDTRHHLETTLATLDGMEKAFLLPSGVSAITFALSAFVQPGDHILMVDSVYGPTRLYCDRELKRLGVEVTYYDPLIGAGIEDLFRETTRLVFTESPGSVTFEVQDIPAIAKVAHRNNALVLEDNTWATPLAPTPAGLGVDVIIHSLTKYACGHSDVLMGGVTASGAAAKTLEKHYKLMGHAVSPDDCYFISRGLRTLAVRVKEQEQTALRLAEWFAARPETLRVLHPAFASCPGHEFWKRDIGQSCGLFAAVIKPYSEDSLANMLDNMKYFAMGYSWGGYESLLIPLNPAPFRTATRWPEDGVLLRVHAGLEAPQDLIEDLEAGFERLNAGA